MTVAENALAIKDHEKRINKLEVNDGKQDGCISELNKDMEKYMKLTDDLQKVVIVSGQAINLGKWILGGFGISIIALIWSLITGQATILFK
jgi:hypothetical protein